MNRRTLLGAALAAPALGLLGTTASPALAESTGPTLDPLMAIVAAHSGSPIEIYVSECPGGRFTIDEQLNYLRKNGVGPIKFVVEHRSRDGTLALLRRESANRPKCLCVMFSNADVSIMIWDYSLDFPGPWLIVDQDFAYEVLDI